MKIIIDPGHGGKWRPKPPRGDPGAVTPDGSKIESNYTWLYALKLREVLSSAGFEVSLTRDHNEFTVENKLRTRGTTADTLFISLHFDTYLPGGRRMIYHASLKNESESKRLAYSIDEFFGSGHIIPSKNSRFGRLYIDDSKGPAILIEIDRIDEADDSEEAMKEFSNKVLLGINKFLGKQKERFSTPFQRVFIIRDGKEEQLEIDRMSIVGDKLYIALK